MKSPLEFRSLFHVFPPSNRDHPDMGVDSILGGCWQRDLAISHYQLALEIERVTLRNLLHKQKMAKLIS